MKVKKKIFALFAAVIIIIVSSLNVSAKKTIEDYFSEMEFPDPVSAIEQTPCLAIYKAESGEAVIGKNTDVKIAPASLTKLVTASVVLLNVSTDEVFTVGSELELVEYDSSVCGIRQGMELTVYDLLCGLLMRSGNDAAYTLAVNVARLDCGEVQDDSESVAYFCGMMNGFLETLGIENSHFCTPDGYDAEGQYTTVEDLAVIASYAMNIETISEITSCAQMTPPFEDEEITVWHNTNFFMHPGFKLYNPNVCGMKTGSTDDAGKCLISRSTKNGETLIVIVSGCKTEGQRYMASQQLMTSYYFSQNFAALTYSMLGIMN